MVTDKDSKHRQMSVGGKYQRLYEHLCSLPAQEWRTSLDEIWPVHSTAIWPENLSLRREDIYEEKI